MSGVNIGKLSALCAAGALVAGCGRVGAVPSDGPSPEAAVDWPAGLTIAGGFRYAVVADGVAWIVTKHTDTNTLELSRMTLADGAITTSTLAGQYPALGESEGLAEDGGGHLWLADADGFIEVDEATGGVKVLTPASGPFGVATSGDDPAAGEIFSASWDSSRGLLLFVRVDDSRLFGLDPNTDEVSTISDLPIKTSVASRVAIAGDGSIAINGQVPGTNTFSPASAVLAAHGGSVTSVAGLLRVCGATSSLMAIDTAGQVSVVGAAGRLLGAFAAPVTSTQPLFACDAAGDVFTAAFVSSADGSHGTFEVDRVSSTGKNSSWTLSLTGHAVDSREPGTPPRIVFDVPEVTALLPDAAAGVWVLDDAGPTSGGQAQSYPSIWRPALDP